MRLSAKPPAAKEKLDDGEKMLEVLRGSGVACVLLGAFLLALLMADNTLPAREDAKPASLPSDLAKIPSDAAFLQSMRIADLWDDELVKPIRQKLVKEFGEAIRDVEKKYGLSADRVERLTLVILDPQPGGSELMFVHTTKPFDHTKVLADKKEQKYKEQTFYSADKEFAVYPLDDQSLVYGTPKAIHGLIDHPTPKMEGNLAAALRLAAGKHSVVYGANVKAFNDALGDKLPGEVEPFKPLLEAISGTLTVDVGEQIRIAAKLTFPTEKDATAGVKPLKSGQDLAVGVIDQGMKELAKQKEMAKIVALLKQAQGALKAAKIEQEGKTLQASAHLKIDVATVGDVALESVRKVREVAARPTRRAICTTSASPCTVITTTSASSQPTLTLTRTASRC